MDIFKPNIDKIKARKDVPGLIKALSYKQDPIVRATAADALGEIGDAGAVEPLLAGLKDEHMGVVSAAAHALGKIGDTRAVEPLIPALKHHISLVRAGAAFALGKIGSDRAVESLIAALNDADMLVRMDVVEALGNLKESRALKPLFAALKNDKSSVRKKAVEILEKNGWKPGEDEASVAYWIEKHKFDECARIGAPAIKPLIAALKEGEFRNRAAEALVKIGDGRTVELLIESLENINANAPGDVVYALETIGVQMADAAIRTRALEALIALLSNKDVNIRRYTAFGLGRIGDTRAIEPLQAAFISWDDHNSLEVNEAIQTALSKLGVSAPQIDEHIQAARERTAKVRAAKRQEEIHICLNCATHLKEENIAHVHGLYCPKCGWATILCYQCKEGWMKATPYTIRPGVPIQARLKCDSCCKESDADYKIIGWLRAHSYPGL